MSLHPGLLALSLLLAACTATTPISPSPGQPTGTATAPPTDSPAPKTSPTAEPTPEAARWAAVDVADGPAAREDHTWTLGPDGRAYLFGGRDRAVIYDDLWAYDPAAESWEQLEPDGRTPPGRFGHGTVWVPGIGLVVHAGQADAITFFDDLWAYDPETNAWRVLPAPQVRPVARYGSCAVLGPDGRLWISHGFTSENARFADTWAYDFAAGSWTEQTPPTERPVNRCLHGCWWTADQFVLYGGQTTGTNSLGDMWALDVGERPGTSDWAQQVDSLPPARNLYAAARLDDATLIFGGQADDRGYLDDLWLIDDDALAASQVMPAGDGPTPRSGAEMVTDPNTGRVLLFGGRDADGAFADVWELTLPGE